MSRRTQHIASLIASLLFGLGAAAGDPAYCGSKDGLILGSELRTDGGFPTFTTLDTGEAIADCRVKRAKNPNEVVFADFEQCLNYAVEKAKYFSRCSHIRALGWDISNPRV